ncbi:hypothetical protein J8L88_15790 [Aquimarina sp. MMG015]|uniref:hypothetical protein n=1 Tax=Aquimarina sp. MMG015 TaxID=2822689 RepID=UPI001B3A47C2|nr:hypothetical protein [Aquimarina sp. MMG015]MBQ4804326.1 hypothetical protein [Aquimarina sp. MMG015]
MLKGKKGLYILLPLVVFIWGAIIFQVVDAFSDEDPVMSTITNVSFATIKTKEREKFSISDVDRDPFLGTIYRPKKTTPKKGKTKSKKQETIWPSIRYKGLVSAQNNSSAIFLVEINGTDQLMKIKDSFSEVQLIKGSSSAIKLKYKGSTKQFQILN